MFALKEIVKNKLFALAEADGSDAFQKCYENWQDVNWLYTFFEVNPKALDFYGVDKKTAVRLILEESYEFFDDILNIVEGKSNATSLDNIVFQPLHEGDDFDLPIIETKAYGTESGTSYLRLYAVRLSDGTYIVVGGLIKTTQALQECEEGKLIIERLKSLSNNLRKSQLIDAFDIGILII